MFFVPGFCVYSSVRNKHVPCPHRLTPREGKIEWGGFNSAKEEGQGQMDVFQGKLT